MRKVLVLGAGKIGRAIGFFLSRAGDYEVRVGDADEAALRKVHEQSGVATVRLDVAEDIGAIVEAMTGCDAVISALSFRFNPTVAEAALRTGASYFDLTEDIQTSRRIQSLAGAARRGQVFVPQCGLAPGVISIIARHLTRSFDRLDTVAMRVGALPQFPSNALKYNLTWSTDGLINEYCNPCEAIHDGKPIDVLPLEGLEQFSLDGVTYEAFNTSGGQGTLSKTLECQVRELNYKTVRYRGHRQFMAFLISDLDLGRRREVLKDILEHAIPVTYQDVVVILCTVSGWRSGELVQVSDARKIYPVTLHGCRWSAIQTTTAAGVCAVFDMHAQGRLPDTGLIRQEDVDFRAFLDNRFGRLYDSPTISHLSVDHTDYLEAIGHA